MVKEKKKQGNSSKSEKEEGIFELTGKQKIAWGLFTAFLIFFFGTIVPVIDEINHWGVGIGDFRTSTIQIESEKYEWKYKPNDRKMQLLPIANTYRNNIWAYLEINITPEDDQISFECIIQGTMESCFDYFDFTENVRRLQITTITQNPKYSEYNLSIKIGSGGNYRRISGKIEILNNTQET